MSFDPNIHVPGAWRCAKCGFGLIQSNLNATDGTVTARDKPGDTCPNDGAPLWRVTWRESYQEMMALAEPMFERDRIIAFICSEEGAVVGLTGDNPDFNGQPNSVVMICAGFTGWCDRDFRADTVIEALRLAEIAKHAFEASQ